MKTLLMLLLPAFLVTPAAQASSVPECWNQEDFKPATWEITVPAPFLNHEELMSVLSRIRRELNTLYPSEETILTYDLHLLLQAEALCSITGFVDCSKDQKKAVQVELDQLKTDFPFLGFGCVKR